MQFIDGAAAAQAADRGLREALQGAHDAEEFERVNSRLTEAITDVLEAAKRAGTVRADAGVSDVAVVMVMLGAVTEVFGRADPDLWRRYLPVLLAGLRAGEPLPVPPLDVAVAQAAMTTYKERLLHGGGGC